MAEEYDRTWHASGATWDVDPTTPLKRSLLLKTLAKRVPPGGRILDLGCGTGQFSAMMTGAGYSVTAADISEEALRITMTNAPDSTTLLLRPEERVPSPERSFDAVWASEVIEHVVDVGLFADEVHRILRPGGVWILTTPFHGVTKNVLIALLKFSRHFDPFGPHLRFFDRGSLERLVLSAGFRLLQCRGIGRTWPVYRNFFVAAMKPPPTTGE